MVLSKEVKDKIDEVDVLIKDLNKKLIEEENVIGFKLQLSQRIDYELSQSFIAAKVVLDLLVQLRDFVQKQDSAINDELEELEEIKLDINTFNKFSKDELSLILRQYEQFKSRNADTKKLSALGRFLKVFVRYKKEGVKITRGVSLTKLWDTIQTLRKTIEKELELGGDIKEYEAILLAIKSILRNQLIMINNIIKDCVTIKKPNALTPLDKETEQVFARLKKAINQLIAEINSEQLKEEKIKKSFSGLHERYIELRNTVIPNA